jgi:hypothetical protein
LYLWYYIDTALDEVEKVEKVEIEEESVYMIIKKIVLVSE